jgi:hypothetical protein
VVELFSGIPADRHDVIGGQLEAGDVELQVLEVSMSVNGSSRGGKRKPSQDL